VLVAPNLKLRIKVFTDSKQVGRDDASDIENIV